MTQKVKIDISDTIQQIGNDAVREAQRKNLENGIPNEPLANSKETHNIS